MPADFETRTADWLDPLVAIENVLETAAPLTAEPTPLLEALGCVLVHPVLAQATLPPWDNSAMDGYAVRASDLDTQPPISLRVTGESLPGVDPSRLAHVDLGTACRIMTGAPVPPGADSVVRVEHTDAEAGSSGVVVVANTGDAGRNVRPGGEDMRQGECVAQAGSRITPGLGALLAAAGADPVTVYRRPKVALIPTGDELKTADQFDQVRAGLGIPETNGRMLALAVLAAGAVPQLQAPVPDREEALREAIEAGMDADVLVTLAGASMGTGDLVKRVLDGFGFNLHFWRVTMRPGSPFGFGVITRPGRPDLPVFSLPGNPASAFVTFELFVRPWLRRAGGHAAPFRPTTLAVTREAFPSNPGLSCFHRVVLSRAENGGMQARLSGKQGSGLVTSLGDAAGLAVVPSAMNACPAGTELRVILLDDEMGSSPNPGFVTVAGT